MPNFIRFQLCSFNVKYHFNCFYCKALANYASIIYILTLIRMTGGTAYLMTEMHAMYALLRGLDVTSVSALIWLGVGPGALATCLQVFGQKHIPPAQAQVCWPMMAY